MKRYLKADSDYDEAEAFNENASKRSMLALDTSSVELLEIYAHDPSASVKESVSRNPHATPDILRDLLDGWVNSNTCLNIVRRDDVPTDVLDKIPDVCQDEDVLTMLAQNPNASDEVILKIFDIAMEQTVDSEDYIEFLWRIAGLQRLPASTLSHLADSDNWRVREAVAHNPNMSPEVLAQLASDEDTNVRIDVARNRNTSVDTLRVLANDEEALVRWGVAANRNTPSDVLAQLAEDEDYDVQASVAQHPNTPDDVLIAMAENFYAANINRLARNNPNYIKALARKSGVEL